jgi:hypothetical protein
MLAALVNKGRLSGRISASEAERLIANVEADPYLTEEQKAERIREIRNRQNEEE